MCSSRAVTAGEFSRGRPVTEDLRTARRRVLVQAAYAVLTERGYERTSMSDIARQAGVGQGTVYRYFTSKRELLDHVFDYAILKAAHALDIESFLREYAESDKSPAPPFITVLGQNLFSLVESEPAILRMLTVESSAIDPELRFRVAGLFAAIDASLAQLFERFAPESTADRTVLTALGRMMAASTGPGLMMSLAKENSEAQRADFLAAMESIAARGLFGHDTENDTTEAHA